MNLSTKSCTDFVIVYNAAIVIKSFNKANKTIIPHEKNIFI